MSSTGTYLNFACETRAAFTFYKSVFGTEFEGAIMTFGEIPSAEGMPPLSENDRDLVMHVCLPILGGHKLMGTDAPASMGFARPSGNNVHISLSPDSRGEADTLFARLSEGGIVTMPLGDMFWGAYYGSCTDRYGVQWMINYESR